MKYPIQLILLVCVLVACKVEPAEISYDGADVCHFCSMGIVDRGHAAQFVTKKGKAFTFDAIECMVNELKDVDSSTLEFILVADLDNPGKWIDARTATYLVHKEIPSPMGEFLSAFKSEEAASKHNQNNSGKVYTWESLELSR